MFYILKEKKPIMVDYEDWVKWIKSNHPNRKVKQTQFNGGMVSTIFLGIDHNFSGFGEPLVFQSLVIGGINDGNSIRFTTWEEAEKGHEVMVKQNFMQNLQLN